MVKIKSDARRYRHRFTVCAVQTMYKQYAEGKPRPLPERAFGFQSHFGRQIENKVRRRMEEWRRAYEFEKIASWFH
jgi:hypothetical protein